MVPKIKWITTLYVTLPHVKKPWASLLIIASGVAAYRNSLSGPFIYDDLPLIANNGSIRDLWPPWKPLYPSPQFETLAYRPVHNLSLAVNYALGGLNVRGYHLMNLAVHLLSALLLFGIVRRTLRGSRLKERYGPLSMQAALTIALLWVVHPLQTESVTYLYQRAESLMGLFYLATLYGVIRGIGSPQRRGWHALAMGACVLGMGCKQVIITAPLLAALYDRIFLSGSWRELFRQRKGLYLGLAAAAWGAFGLLLAVGANKNWANSGFAFKGISPWDYLLTQPGVILHYLKLSLWPRPLVLDYNWPVARSVKEILPPALAVAGLGCATLWALRRRPEAGFLGAWFFLILSPTSTFIPNRDPAVEHRMYLPLAAVIALVVIGGIEALRALFPFRRRLARNLAIGLAAASAITLGAMTLRRNQDYRSETAIWSDVVEKRPQNPRAHSTLGAYLAEQGRLEEAIRHQEKALSIDPTHAQAHVNLGNALFRQGKLEEAARHYEEAARLCPGWLEPRYNLGRVRRAIHESERRRGGAAGTSAPR
ncbi:MAG: tetratricopeptide repeat protein [Candidatus Omnitrophica bacterium]|nr:tetratricopeptide repeat protein [Candidatus Omnitrophota bacterium]